MIATCVPPLLSSRRSIVVFGALNLGAAAVLASLLATGVISLWCAWAAVASAVIVIHQRTAEDRSETPLVTADGEYRRRQHRSG